MFVHNFDPVFLALGPLQIRYYGLVYALGFLLAYYVLLRKKESIGASEEQIASFILYIMIGMLVGARIFHFMVDNVSGFIADPLELFRVWHGGMSFFGGFLGSVIAGAMYAKKQKLDWLCVGDILVFPLALALIFGRIANFINGELVGIPTDVPWCVVFPATDTLCRHSYQLYASLSHLVLLGMLYAALKMKDAKNYKNGFLLMTFAAGYAGLRFLTDFFREDSNIVGLTPWQWISLCVFFATIIFLFRTIKQKSI